MVQPRKSVANYSITAAGVAHAALLSNLQQAAYSPQGERVWSAKSFAETLSAHGVLARIIEVAKAPVGFCLMRVVAREAEVLTIGILPTAQQQGLGKALLLNCIEAARKTGSKTVFLEVRADNSTAIPMYRACGFLENGKRENYYRLENGQLRDAATYCLNL